MPTIPSTKKWINVPDNSTFILTTSADPPDVDIKIGVHVNGKLTATWTNDDVLNKTKKLKLKSPKRYQLVVDIVFANKTTLEFDARIEKEDGSQHGSTYGGTATKPPTVHHADLSIITKDEA